MCVFIMVDFLICLYRFSRADGWFQRVRNSVKIYRQNYRRKVSLHVNKSILKLENVAIKMYCHLSPPALGALKDTQYASTATTRNL